MYKDKYKQIDKRTIKAVRSIVKQGLFKAKPNIRLQLLKQLNKELSEIYEVKEPQIKVCGFCGDGMYNISEDIIFLNNKLSLVTYLHEFKHQLQHKKQKVNNEEVARGWSISVFYTATPKLCENAIKKGLIIYETATEME
jgi:hypothetical protein